MTQQEANKLLNERFNKQLQEMKFPSELIPVPFPEWLKISLPYHNIYSLQCDMEILSALWNKSIYDMNMLEVINAINAIQQTFAYQWHEVIATDMMWVYAQEKVYKMSKIWTEITTPMQDDFKRQVQKEFDEAARKEDAEREKQYKKNQIDLSGDNFRIPVRNIVKAKNHK